MENLRELGLWGLEVGEEEHPLQTNFLPASSWSSWDLGPALSSLAPQLPDTHPVSQPHGNTCVLQCAGLRHIPPTRPSQLQISFEGCFPRPDPHLTSRNPLGSLLIMVLLKNIVISVPIYGLHYTVHFLRKEIVFFIHHWIQALSAQY